LRTILRAEQQLPKVFAEARCFLVEKAGQLDLHGLDIGISTAFNQIEDEINDDVVFPSHDIVNLPRNPCFHDLDIDLLHVHFRVELGRELGAL